MRSLKPIVSRQVRCASIRTATPYFIGRLCELGADGTAADDGYAHERTNWICMLMFTQVMAAVNEVFALSRILDLL